VAAPGDGPDPGSTNPRAQAHLVVLLAAHVFYEVLRKAGIAKLDRRGIEYMAQNRGGI
jgi:hypothetical protein